MKTGIATLMFGTALGAMLGIEPAAKADTTTVGVSKDNTLYEDSGGVRSNGAGPHMYVGNTLIDGVRRALVAFDLSTIPGGSTITGVSLRMNVSQAGANSENVALHRVLADWGEGTSNAGSPGGAGASATPGDATWVHRSFDQVRWTTPGGDFDLRESGSVRVGGTGLYTWLSTPQMVADVQGWMNDPRSNFGWLLLGDERTAQTAKRFDSRENPDSALRPALEVTYTVPTPMGAVVVIGGVGAVATRRRRKA